jgi:cell division protein FtsB
MPIHKRSLLVRAPGQGSTPPFNGRVYIQVEIGVSNAQKILLSLVTLVLLNILLVIVFGDRGLVEVGHLKGERDQLLKDNNDLKEKNLALRREIERLKTDPAYIEHVARQELGMIGRDEVIVRFNSPGKKVIPTPEKDKQP